MARAARSDQTVATSLVQLVYRDTRRAILQGDLLPGQPLRLQQLADEAGVSLIPVREALRLLEGDRLVATVPNKGAYVAPLSLDDMHDAYRLRIVLETEALRQAYPNLTEELIDEGFALKDEMVRAFEAGEEEGYELHRRLHFLLYEPSGSDWLLHFIEMLWNATERYWRLATPLHPTSESVGDAHMQALAPLHEGDLEAAVEGLRRDLEGTVKLLVEHSEIHALEDSAGA